MNPRTLSDRQRRELIRREQAAQRDLLSYYGVALDRVHEEVASLHDLMADAEALGNPTLVRRLLKREHRLDEFEMHTRVALTAYAEQAAHRITMLQRGAVGQAVGDSQELTLAALGPAPAGIGIEFRPPSPAVAYKVIGISGDGGPLAHVLSEAAGDAAGAARRELVVGIIRGKGPREIARNVSKASGIARNRSLLISRTESIRAYRATTLDAYQANPSVVKGWVWQCAFDTRTCPACWAMSGTEHAASESLNSHPGCRCCMLPQTVSWSDLGFDGIKDSRPQVTKGVDAFDKLDAAQQRQILGPGKYTAYRDGELSLPDLVKDTHSDRWGPGRREATLAEALAA